MILTRQIAALLLAAFASLALMGGSCSKGPDKKPVVWERKFSVNVTQTPAFWPREKLDWPEDPAQRRAQQDAYALYGKPDYLRAVHTWDRRLIRPNEMGEHASIPGRRPEIVVDWIYMARGTVLEFDTGEINVTPLTDKLRTICMYGDPNDVQFLNPEGDTSKEKWVYYNLGRNFVFLGDTIMTTESFPVMSGYEHRL